MSMHDEIQNLTAQLTKAEADRIDAVRGFEEKAPWGDMMASRTSRAEPLRAPLCMIP